MGAEKKTNMALLGDGMVLGRSLLEVFLFFILAGDIKLTKGGHSFNQGYMSSSQFGALAGPQNIR